MKRKYYPISVTIKPSTVKIEDNHIDELLQDAMGKEMSTGRVLTLVDSVDQKDMIKNYLEDGGVISCDYFGPSGVGWGGTVG